MIVAWFIVGALIGAVIGQTKHRVGAGAAFGALLGPVGWLMVGLGPNLGPKCSECGGNVVPDARRCKNCGALRVGLSTAPINGEHLPPGPSL